MHVLLVEDDGVVCMYLAEMLGDVGMDVTEAPSAERALALPNAATPPAVLVSDVHLGPGMDGITLAAEAHRRWPGLRVVLISGTAFDLLGPRLHPSDRFLSKPFSDAALLRAIGEAADGGRLGSSSAST